MEIQAPKKNKRSATKVLLVILIILIILLVGVAVTYVWTSYAKLTGELDAPEVSGEFETDPEAENLPDVTFNGGEVPELIKKEGMIDIMLVGVDNRQVSKFTGRSDVLMYLRIDNNTGSIKLVSIMRDTLVAIDEHGYNKINTAFMFGSAELAEKTLKENLGLDPDFYVVVNFYGMEDIIDALGGVDIELTKEEVNNMNTSIDELNKLDPDGSAEHVDGSGVKHLNGRQAVAYMRVRKVGGDQTRVLRQQAVLQELFKKAKDLGIVEMTGLVGTVAEYVRTDMNLTTMMDLATLVKNMGIDGIETHRYPDEFKNGRYEGMSVVQPEDFSEEITKLHDFLDN